MASLISSSPVAATRIQHKKLSAMSAAAVVGGLRFPSRIQLKSVAKRTSVSKCSTAATTETLKEVQSTIAKQLSIEESTVTPQTKFADLGADSLDTVEIMMALEEKFEVSVGEGGAENISTVQDAADLIEKVKAA